ncbi:MAG: hypothetical protein OEV49_09100 [candidate division Zixibacteria bacterium]|nr:hypothetical protein [candidate division Zixibacteria bacterium]MDH3935758.1 hypothetical protein [candidate division Zixibacteria bacterium]MDH4032555.1 hypothetical protein [candidate division Zixibacteria bacterium]
MEHSDTNKSRYYLNEDGEFIITDYNSSKPFSSFFPGIAGVNGIPMWVFYVNRGQCISSMGIQDKDHSIMEFLPANWAYNLVARQGFRTFIKLSDDSSCSYYEPFQSHYIDRQLKRTQRMIIAPSHLTLEEVNHSLNLKFSVEYFTVPQDNYAGLVRTLRIDNLGPDSVALDGLDGLPLIVPYGVDNFCLKNMRRTIEAFVEVSNFCEKVPFFRSKVEPDDRADVMRITRGNFYVGFETDGSDTNIIAPIVDPTRIFGTQSDLSYPKRFLAVSAEEVFNDQILENQLPCAMGLFRATIPAGESYTYTSIIGHASSIQELNGMVPHIASRDYAESKAQTNQEIVQTLTQNNLICSSEPTLDHYVRQNFLDNVMRGGLPYTIDGDKARSTLYLYSRKHGDMERDYNDFRLMPTYYSQGNGNFRDINQNRRSDVLFNPDIQEYNVEYFYNLIQLDGFNPLVLGEIYFAVGDRDKLYSILEKFIEAEHVQTVKSFFDESFTPGELLVFLDEQDIALGADSEIFLGEILDHCRRICDPDHGEGFWTDHWTYNLDLLENYLAVYPDKFPNLLFWKKTFSFYDNPHRVLPREDKYVLWEQNAMQLGAVVLDEEKERLIENRDQNPNQVRIQSGTGDVYYTSLFNKILCLIVNKLASLDPEGVGVEMEAGKPSWYDALNGLPGLFGSSISESLEIKRHILFLIDKLHESKIDIEEIAIFEELSEFMETVHDILTRNLSPFEFWDSASTAKEHYREKIRMGISGKETTVEFVRIRDFFAAALGKLNEGIEKARDQESNTLFTYFCYDVTGYQMLETTDSHGEKKPKYNANGQPCIKALEFKQVALPLFLEGPVHYLKCLTDMKEAKEFAASVKASGLYDSPLKMYKVNASLSDQPLEIGRARVFSPGWLENESIWLHMEYKYLLELLRAGLYSEFFQEFKNVCIPFLNPDVYGRSLLENSSFIVSSAHPDQSIHGNGFVARLSGATAEFIHIVQLMAVGPRPFRLSPKGELQLGLNLSLPGWLFTQETRKIRLFRQNQWQEVELPARTFTFMFLGKILVTYHNIELKDTYGAAGVTPAEWRIADKSGIIQTFNTETLSGEIAYNIRERKVDKIDIVLR